MFHEHLTAIYRALKELGLDQQHAQVSVLICQRCSQHWLKYFYENEGFTASGRWFLGAISFDQVSSLTPENARKLLEELDWYFVGGSYYGTQISKSSGEIHLSP